MITKILLTLAVIVVAVLMLRSRQGRPDVNVVATNGKTGRRWIKVLAISVISLMIIATLAFVFFEWQSSREILEVSVVDSRSSHSVEYQVRRGDIDNRSFQTLDGRYVQLAETERMEVSPAR